MKEIEYGDVYGEGEVICTCEYCYDTYACEFSNGVDFKEAQREIRENGWTSTKIFEEWHDFCCEECRNNYIKENA